MVYQYYDDIFKDEILSPTLATVFYELRNDPNIFNLYKVSSPSVNFDDNIILIKTRSFGSFDDMINDLRTKLTKQKVFILDIDSNIFSSIPENLTLADILEDPSKAITVIRNSIRMAEL